MPEKADSLYEAVYEVAANHIDLVLTCHPDFNFLYIFVGLLNQYFIKLVAHKGHIKWRINELRYESGGTQLFMTQL